MQKTRKSEERDEHIRSMLTTADCLALLREHHLPEMLLRHIRKVDGICMYLTAKLIEQGIAVDADLLHAAALLHDIKKMEQVQGKNEGHEEAGERYLTHLGYPVIGELIRAHQITAIFQMMQEASPEQQSQQQNNQQQKDDAHAWEKKLIYYADKRVKHDAVVSIDERLDDAIQRYPQEQHLIEGIRVPLKALEKEIFKNTGLSSVEEADIVPYLIEETLIAV